jgi:hypothetical protein
MWVSNEWTIKRQLLTAFGGLVLVAVSITIIVSGSSIGVTGDKMRALADCGRPSGTD